MNYREQFYEGEIDGKSLLDVIDEKEAEAQALSKEVAALRARVVVPERMQQPEECMIGTYQRIRGWNDCRDEVVRLSGKAVSEGLLRRIDESMCDYLGEDDPLRMELAVLLGEGKES